MINILSYVVILVIFNTAGQLLLKNATFNVRHKKIYLFMGYSLFLMTMGISFLLLKIIELKYFTIIMSINYISVILASSYFFKEKLNLEKIIGILIVVIGIVIFTLDVFDDNI